MSNLCWLPGEQMARLQPFFPKSHGHQRGDTLYNRWKRWNEMGIFARIFEGLAAKAAEPTTIMIDAPHLKAHRSASSLRAKKGGLDV